MAYGESWLVANSSSNSSSIWKKFIHSFIHSSKFGYLDFRSLSLLRSNTETWNKDEEQICMDRNWCYKPFKFHNFAVYCDAQVMKCVFWTNWRNVFHLCLCLMKIFSFMCNIFVVCIPIFVSRSFYHFEKWINFSRNCFVRIQIEKKNA